MFPERYFDINAREQPIFLATSACDLSPKAYFKWRGKFFDILSIFIDICIYMCYNVHIYRRQAMYKRLKT